jgi:hypothetical protein
VQTGRCVPGLCSNWLCTTQSNFLSFITVVSTAFHCGEQLRNIRQEQRRMRCTAQANATNYGVTENADGFWDFTGTSSSLDDAAALASSTARAFKRATWRADIPLRPRSLKCSMWALFSALFVITAAVVPTENHINGNLRMFQAN